MKWKRIRSWPFWINVALFFIASFLAVWGFKFSNSCCTNTLLRLLVLGIASFLFVLNEVFRDRPYIDAQIQLLLSSVDMLKILDSDQNLRANLFCYKTPITKFRIVYSHNMENDPDKDLEIPHNRGCTGRAWTDRTQIWAVRNEFLDPSKICTLPPTELAKVREDLQWICSTPVIRKGKALAILNFDGNRAMSTEMKERIQQHASRIADALVNLLD